LCNYYAFSDTYVDRFADKHKSIGIEGTIIDMSLNTYALGLKKNKDDSITMYFGPDAPKDKKMAKNWLQTVPGKRFFVCLRMYGPTQPWIDGVWRPSTIELVK